MITGKNLITAEQIPYQIAKSLEQMNSSLSQGDPFRNFYMNLCMPQESRAAEYEGMRKKLEQNMRVTNAMAKAFRENSRKLQKFPTISDLMKSGKVNPADMSAGYGALSKAQLDIGTNTNLAQVTGGQSLGYISLDTRLARGTVRPSSFTLYQHLHKSAAYQVVDYWPYAYDAGAGLPGAAFQGFSNVSSGTLSTNAGLYELQYINLKLAVDGRSITTALAAQNSYVDIAAQENINAALGVLQSINWGCYYGNSTIFPNQFNGIGQQLLTNVPQNIFDFQVFYNNYAAQQGWSSAQTLFNMIYETAAQITSYRQYGRITHAFMTPTTAGSLQSLVTTTLNNIVTSITSFQDQGRGILIDGDLQGMRTRFGEIQFPIDLFISARNKPAQAIILENGQTSVTGTAAGPASVTSAIVAPSAVTASGLTSEFTATYAAAVTAYGTTVTGTGIYSYGFVGCDAYMNESNLVFLPASGPTSGFIVSGIAANGAYTFTISGNSTNTAYRVFRSGLGYCPTGSGTSGVGGSGAINVAAYRWVATVANAASAGGNTQYTDVNAQIPGGEDVWLLDMDEQDYAIDFRYLLPLTKIELFAQNLFMPWAVAMIGAIRLRIPKYHGQIKNYVPDSTQWSPLSPNPLAS